MSLKRRIISICYIASRPKGVKSRLSINVRMPRALLVCMPRMPRALLVCMATMYVYHSLLSRRVSVGTWIRVQLFFKEGRIQIQNFFLRPVNFYPDPEITLNFGSTKMSFIMYVSALYWTYSCWRILNIS